MDETEFSPFLYKYLARAFFLMVYRYRMDYL